MMVLLKNYLKSNYERIIYAVYLLSSEDSDNSSGTEYNIE